MQIFFIIHKDTNFKKLYDYLQKFPNKLSGHLIVFCDLGIPRRVTPPMNRG